VRFEDDMLVTESGAELFTPPSRSLEQPFWNALFLNRAVRRDGLKTVPDIRWRARPSGRAG
jgi:hypothetical protein